MKNYYAGLGMLKKALIEYRHKTYAEGKVLHFLYSYLEVLNRNYSILKDGIYEKDQILLDSGAFTAFTMGRKIDIYDYIDVIKDSGVSLYATLDVIGDAEGTYKNYLIMREKGVNPIPVFHQKEDTKFLYKYLESCDYIALGGMVGYTPEKLIPFLDTCFAIIKNYWPKKIHGFGVGSVRLWKRYPFYSVDSTSWLTGGKFRKVVKFVKGDLVSFQKEDDERGLQNMRTKIDNYSLLNLYNIEQYEKMAKYVTDIWKERGIDWSKY
jgi:hypothetical protein